MQPCFFRSPARTYSGLQAGYAGGVEWRGLWEEGVFAMMYGSYMDESFDPQVKGKPTGVFAVGGVIGSGVLVFELERAWERLLKRPDIDIDYFKASECERGTKQFRKFVADPDNITPAEREKLDSVSHEFLRLIGRPVPFDARHFLCVQGTGVVQSDFYDVIKEPNARAILGKSPYRLAYDLAMIQCAWAMKELGDGKPAHGISFICDEDEEHSAEAEPAYRNLKKTNPVAAEYMATFSMADEKKCAPLQAADAAVYEVRRSLNLVLKQWSGKLRKQFDILTEEKALFLVTHTKKEQLEWIVANHKPGQPFNLDELMNNQLGENIDAFRS